MRPRFFESVSLPPLWSSPLPSFSLFCLVFSPLSRLCSSSCPPLPLPNARVLPLLWDCVLCTGAVVFNFGPFLVGVHMFMVCFCVASDLVASGLLLCTGAAFYARPVCSRIASVWFLACFVCIASDLIVVIFCTGAVVSARLAWLPNAHSGSLCLGFVVWVWPALPGPWPENRPFLIEPLEGEVISGKKFNSQVCFGKLPL